MNVIDHGVLTFLNQFAQQSTAFDRGVVLVDGLYLSQGIPLVLAFWWLWFRDGASQHERREVLLATLLACLVAVLIARGLAHILPFRVRPFADPSLGFVAPSGAEDISLGTWSSFPSDHATLFFGLALGLFAVSRAVGSLALVWTLVFVAFPRMYIGEHYPTDLLAGLLLGAAVVWLFTRRAPRRAIANVALRWGLRSPFWFYAVVAFLTFEIATLFYDLRAIATFVLSLAIPGYKGSL